MKHGGPLIHRLKTLISSVQDHYPELIHQAIIAHAPATFSKLFALVSSVLNDRMRSKILVAPATGPITPVAERISARALHMRSAAGWRVIIRATGRHWRAWAGVGTLCDAPRRKSRPPDPHNPRSGRTPAAHLNARARTQSGDAAGRDKGSQTRNRTNFCRAPVYDSWMPRSQKRRFSAT